MPCPYENCSCYPPCYLRLLRNDLDGIIISHMHPEEITLKWLGSGGFEFRFQNRLMLIDPFFSRPYDAIPRLPISRQDYKKYDLLLSTHAGFNQFADVPYLAATVDAPVYVPECGRKDLKKVWKNLHHSARTGNPDNWRSIENTGKIKLGELSMTPLTTSSAGFDFANAWELAKRLLGYSPPDEAVKRGLAFSTTHPLGPSFAMYMDWKERGSRMLFFGSLSKHVFNVTPDAGRVDVLAIPYFPNNRQNNRDTARLVERFQPEAIIVHQFDQWLPPITTPRNTNEFKSKLRARFPGLPVYVPEPLKSFTLEDVLGAK